MSIDCSNKKPTARLYDATNFCQSLVRIVKIEKSAQTSHVVEAGIRIGQGLRAYALLKLNLLVPPYVLPGWKRQWVCTNHIISHRGQ